MTATYDKLREAEPLGKRHAALLCVASATVGWAFTLAAFYAAYCLLDL